MHGRLSMCEAMPMPMREFSAATACGGGDGAGVAAAHGGGGGGGCPSPAPHHRAARLPDQLRERERALPLRHPARMLRGGVRPHLQHKLHSATSVPMGRPHPDRRGDLLH